MEQDAGREVGEFFGGATGFAPEPGELDPPAVVMTFNGEGVGQPLQPDPSYIGAPV